MDHKVAVLKLLKYYIELACDGRASDQSWSVGVLNGMLTSLLALHTTTYSMYVYLICKSVNILNNTTQEYILYNIIQR